MRILLITDTHLAPGRTDWLANWETARRFAAAGGIDLTVHLGDITRDAWTAPDELAFAAGLAADWPTRLYFVPGNHDVGDNPAADDLTARQPLSTDLLTAYRTHFGDDCWAADIPGADGAPSWRLIGINAQLLGTGGAAENAQWEWLVDAIGGAGGARLAVFSHKPLYQVELEAEPPHQRYVPNGPRRRLLDLLGAADWRLWLSGHAHQFRQRTLGTVHHAWIPSLAFRFPDSMQEAIGEKIVGAAVLTLDDAGCRLDLVIPDGTLQTEYNPKTDV